MFLRRDREHVQVFRAELNLPLRRVRDNRDVDPVDVRPLRSAEPGRVARE